MCLVTTNHDKVTITWPDNESVFMIQQCRVARSLVSQQNLSSFRGLWVYVSVGLVYLTWILTHKTQETENPETKLFFYISISKMQCSLNNVYIDMLSQPNSNGNVSLFSSGLSLYWLTLVISGQPADGMTTKHLTVFTKLYCIDAALLTFKRLTWLHRVNNLVCKGTKHARLWLLSLYKLQHIWQSYHY